MEVTHMTKQEYASTMLCKIAEELDRSLNILSCVHTGLDAPEPPQEAVSATLLMTWNQLNQVRNSVYNFIDFAK